jgi:hypothetical protein
VPRWVLCVALCAGCPYITDQQAADRLEETASEEEDCEESLWWYDDDGDTWGAGSAIPSCTPLPDHAPRPGDCGDDEVHPGADEVCDWRDDDCDPDTRGC